MSEQLKILEMIEKGQLTAAEGMELIEALRFSKESAPAKAVEFLPSAPKHNYKFFKIKVTSDNKAVNVNVNIPIRLLTSLGEMASKMSAMVPPDARKQMESKGVDISTIDFAKIIEELLNGTLDDPNIVDVEAWDEEHQAMVKVRIYVE